MSTPEQVLYPLFNWEGQYSKFMSSSVESGYTVENPNNFTVMAINPDSLYGMEGRISLIKQLHAATANEPIHYSYYLGWATQVNYFSEVRNNSQLLQWFSIKMVASNESKYLHWQCNQSSSNLGTITLSVSQTIGLYDLASLEGRSGTIRGDTDAELTPDWGQWNAASLDLPKLTDSTWHAMQCAAAIQDNWTDEGKLTGFKVGD